MANRAIQPYVLYELLKSAGIGNVVTREQVIQTLKVNESSIPVYFSILKNKFGVKFETVKNGRNVTGYKLVSDDVEVRSERLNAKKVAPKKPVVAIPTKTEVKNDGIIDLDCMEMNDIDQAEFDDIRTQLGLA